MALDIKIGIVNEKSSLAIADITGDYNAVTNPGGWGSPNPTRASTSSISLNIYYPGTSTPSISSINLYTTTFFTSTDRAYDLSSLVTLQDGVWKFVTTFVISSITYTITTYSLRVNSLKCVIGQLALGDMDVNGFDEIKTMYDKMVQAFECGEYILAQDLYEEINDMLSDCSPTIKGCGC